MSKVLNFTIFTCSNYAINIKQTKLFFKTSLVFLEGHQCCRSSCTKKGITLFIHMKQITAYTTHCYSRDKTKRHELKTWLKNYRIDRERERERE